MSTYTPIASQTLSSSAATVTFSNIPQNFTDLVLVSTIKDSNGYSVMRFNSDSGNNYSRTWMYGNGTTAASNRGTNISGLDLKAETSGSTFAPTITHINNYSNTTTNKTILIRQAQSGEVAAYVGLWRNTGAITSITITNDMQSGSTFNLYGIASASASTGKASGGNIVTTDGTYWYHTFTSSGTFTPLQALTADYLVVAGGAGGYISGGGAGGLRSTVTATGGGGSLETPLSLTAQAYTVTVGAGGAVATDGNNSVFSTITSNKGGNGGSNGSGNGGAVTSGAAGTSVAGAAGTANQGYAGGTSTKFGSTSPTYWGGAGGGGAGAIGGAGRADSNPATSAGGNGGNGVAVAISGTSVTYAGGGGGYNEGNTARATGGSGGGGDADNSSNTGGTAGTANTGGGGGGRSAGGGGYAGGSGIVVVRYAV